MAIKTTKGRVSTFEELMGAITAWVTDTEIHGTDAWELMRNEPWPYGTIYKAKGREDGDRQYIGMMLNKYKKGTTYNNWFISDEHICTYFLWSGVSSTVDFYEKRALNGDYPLPVISGGTITFPGQNKIFAFPHTEIFESDAQALHFGTFKQFSGAPFADLGGAINLSGVPLFPCYVVEDGRSSFQFQLPMYPGCGYPALTLDYNGPIEGYFDYWLIKTASYLIIVTKNSDVWESAFWGQFDPYDALKEYAFPAVAVGATSGLREVIKKIQPAGYQRPFYLKGNMFDFRPHAWELSRSIPPYAGIPQDIQNTVSPVMAMLPDGAWKAFANYVQGYQHIPAESSRQFFVRPGENDVSDFFVNISEKDEHLLEPVELATPQGVIGKIPQMFLPAKPIHEYGEIVTEDGKKYLAIPNGWEGRQITSKPTLMAKLPVRSWPNSTPTFQVLEWPYESEMNYFDQMLAEEREVRKKSSIMNLMIRMED